VPRLCIFISVNGTLLLSTHRCRRRLIFEGAKYFCPNFLNTCPKKICAPACQTFLRQIYRSKKNKAKKRFSLSNIPLKSLLHKTKIQDCCWCGLQKRSFVSPGAIFGVKSQTSDVFYHSVLFESVETSVLECSRILPDFLGLLP